MTHKPGVPPGSVAPYPAHPAPHENTVQAGATVPATDNSISKARAPTSGISILGTAVGIGSAAIVAALLYTRRGRR
jgi:hypothetical protein